MRLVSKTMDREEMTLRFELDDDSNHQIEVYDTLTCLPQQFYTASSFTVSYNCPLESKEVRIIVYIDSWKRYYLKTRLCATSKPSKFITEDISIDLLEIDELSKNYTKEIKEWWRE